MYRLTVLTASSALAALAVLAASAPKAFAYDPPPMRIVGVSIDFTDPVNVEVFVQRTAAESRAYCAVHHARVTPDHGDEPTACERAMGDRAVRALPTPAWRAFVRAGGIQALHRRQR